ncbi:MAG: DUF2341 domain-containing protein [Candidatus Nealsonbacteria bacterium]|nr:DUF2341 domain-containing protein [Candidatus Nealsonbacteria bacterium]
MLIYDIIPPNKIKEFAKEKILGITTYKTKSRKYFAFSWRGILLFFIIFYFFSGITPLALFKKSIQAISKKEITTIFFSDFCSGDWEFPQNAQGYPEIGSAGDIDLFSEENSAIYKTGNLTIICQNFSATVISTTTTISLTPTNGTTTELNISETTTTEITTTETTTTQATSAEVIFIESTSTSEIKEEGVISTEATSTTTSTLPETTTEPTSFLKRIKQFLGQKVFAQENVFSAKIKFSFAIGEKEESILPPEQSTTTTSTQPQATSSELEINSNSTGTISTATSTFQEMTTTTTETTTTATTSETLTEVEPKIIIWFSLDGELWEQLDIISSYPLSNALNGGYFSYVAPFLKNWEDVENLKIKFEGVFDGQTNVTTFLDSVWIEVEYQEEEEFELRAIKENWRADEIPVFEILPKGENAEENIIESLIDRVSSVFEEEPKIEAKLDNPQNQELELQVGKDFKAETHSPTKITIFKPEDFRPGRYHLKIDFEKNGKIHNLEQDFTWGVLAINTNKSIYLPGEEAYLQMAVLDNWGLMVCDADLTLEIISPQGIKTILKTSDGTILVNRECKIHGITEKPDYEAHYETDGVGVYLINLFAITQSGTHSITDSFEVRDSVPFDIERQGPTRILPTEPYTMKFIIKVNQDFDGTIQEPIPKSFEILKTELFLVNNVPPATTSVQFDEKQKIEVSIEPFQIITQEDKKIINWTVQWQNNQIYELSYQFDAPDYSPAFYLLGTLKIGNWQEARFWQIAGDAWLDSNWLYRKLIPIQNTTSTLTDYQVKITIATTTGGNVTCNGHCKNNFDDIKFTADDGDTSLSFWRESYATSATSTFWVKIPSLTGSATTSIYMYYGNSNATTSSNGSSTFDFFDDFSGNLSKWTIDASNTDAVYIATSSGNPYPSLRHNPDSTQSKNAYFDTRLITTNYQILNGIIEYDVYLAGSPRIIHQFGWRVPSLSFANGYCWRLQNSAADGGHLYFTGITSWTAFGTAYPATTGGVWHHVKEVVSGSTYTAYVDGGSGYSGTNSTKLTADYLVSHVHGVSLDSSSYVLVDNIRVRKYASPEPSIGTAGNEEQSNQTPTVSSVSLNNGENITLIEGTTVNVTSTATTSDLDGLGDIATTTGKIYRSGLSATSACALDDNNCYEDALCATSTEGSWYRITCSFDVYFHADPTDIYAPSPWNLEHWIAWIKVIDSGNASSSATNTAETVDVYTLRALEVTEGNIPYGLVDAGTSTGGFNPTTTIVNVGNSSIDLELSGNNLCTNYPGCSGNTIGVSNQEYSTSSFNWGTRNDLSTATSSLNVDLPKPTSSPSASTDIIYWGLGVPLNTAVGTYTGENTFTAIGEQ